MAHLNEMDHLGHHVPPWSTMGHHGAPWTTMDHHGSPSTTANELWSCRGLSAEAETTPVAKKKAPASKGGDWKGHLKKTFEAGKKKDPKYKYSQAMKDAKITYKK